VTVLQSTESSVAGCTVDVSMWCLGHARSTRFDGECKFHVPRYDAESLAAMQNTGRFWPAWFASYKDYVKMHWAWTLPLFYLVGLLCRGKGARFVSGRPARVLRLKK